MEEMSGSNAAVTGAGSGIGRAIAEVLAENGFRVAVADVDEAGGSETVERINANGGTARFDRVDVTDQDQVTTWLDSVAEGWGGLDALANNAGINGPTAPLEEYSAEDFARVISIDLISVSLCSRAAIPHFRARGKGSIVNTGSTASLQGYAGLSAYTAAKHGVLGLTRSFALEYADIPIRANCICPGPVDTPLMQGILKAIDPENPQEAAAMFESTSALKRFADAREIAQVAAFLLGDLSSYVTGAAIAVDGGITSGV